MAEKVVGGLKWVKGEIAVTLRRITGLVERYGQTGEPASLGDAVDALFEVRGVLLALQLAMPARLVDEMQRLCDAMGDRRVRSPMEAAEAMMLALIQLPSHLDQLDAAAEIPPLSLWPIINDLRESRGVPPLSAAELLVPGSVLAEEEEDLPPEALEALTAVFRKVRPHFHRDLVDWYRPASSREGIIKLGRLFHQLHRYLKDGILADLFRLAEVYADGLQGGDIVGGPPALALVGRLDRVFKPLVRSPPEWPDIDAHQLIDAFLAELAKAGIKPPAVAEIQAHYGQVPTRLAPSVAAAAALSGLASAMLGEFGALKERLDQFVRGERDDRTPLDEIRAVVRNLARTCDVADAGDLAERLRTLADGFGELALADAAEDVRRLQPLAGELLGIEAVLQAYAECRTPSGAGSASGIDAAALPTSTLREATDELLIESADRWFEAQSGRPGASAAAAPSPTVASAPRRPPDPSAALLVTDQGSPDLPALALLGSGPWSVAVPRVAASEETASVGGVEAASVLLDQGGLAERLAELRGGDDADPADEPGAAEDSSGADLILRDSDLLDFFDESAVGKGHEDLEFAPFGEDEGVLSADDLPQQGLVSAPRSAAADAVDPNARDRFDDMAMRRAVDDLPALMAVPPPEDLAKAASDALAAELQEALEALDAESVPSAPAPRATALDETASATPGPAAEVPDRPDPMPLRTPAAPASGWGFSERVPDLGPASQPESAGDGKSAAQSAAAVELMVVPSVGPGVADTQGDAEPVGEGATVARLRVRSAVLNRLVDGAGEIGLYRARLSQRNGLLGAVLLALDQTMRRLHDQLHQLEIETAALIRDRGEHEPSAAGEGSEGDPRAVDRFSTLHQLARGLAGIGKDLLGQRDLISGYQRQSTDLLAQQARLTDHLQDGLLGARMVPFGQVVPRLRRILRSTADCLGKVVRLEVIGPEVELDRLTLDRLAAPLEQLVRNAVDHGLETPSARVAAGKPATGTVTVALSRDGDEVLLTLSDDGRGLDLAAIRAKAQARGLLSLAAESAPTDLMQFLFEPDFSTPELETQSAGRGAGLAVVAVAVKSLHGAVELASPGGLGTSVSIRLPLTRAILNVFLVGVGDQTYAVPHATVEGAARIGRDDLAAIYQGQRRDFEHNGHTYRVAHLGGLLDSQGPPVLGERRWLPLLLAHLGEQRVALQVDTLTESTRVIVKPLAGPLAALHWLAGGTILPDGRVALILDPLALLRGGTAHRW